MSTNQTETHRNEGNGKLKEVADKVTGDESAEHTPKTKNQAGKDNTVLGELNDNPGDEKKEKSQAGKDNTVLGELNDNPGDEKKERK